MLFDIKYEDVQHTVHISSKPFENWSVSRTLLRRLLLDAYALRFSLHQTNEVGLTWSRNFRAQEIWNDSYQPNKISLWHWHRHTFQPPPITLHVMQQIRHTTNTSWRTKHKIIPRTRMPNTSYFIMKHSHLVWLDILLHNVKALRFLTLVIGFLTLVLVYIEQSS